MNKIEIRIEKLNLTRLETEQYQKRVATAVIGKVRQVGAGLDRTFALFELVEKRWAL